VFLLVSVSRTFDVRRVGVFRERERERERESCVAIAMAENDSMEVEAAAAVVPETLLKKRKRDEEWASARKQQLEAARSKNAKNRQLIFKRAEQYIKEYRSQVWGNRCSIWNFVSLM